MSNSLHGGAAAALLATFSLSHAQSALDAGAVVVTATRFPERRLDAPVGMTIIGAEEIVRDPARSLPELLSRLGALHVRDNSGSPDFQVDLRGFGITADQNTLVLLDGVRLNENDLSSTKLSSIPLNAIERIEILRGSGAVLYGGGASGGTINIITRGPRAAVPGAELFAGGGSYGTSDARVQLNTGDERFGALFSGTHLESRNYRANNRLRQENASGDIRYVADSASVALKLGADSQRLGLPGTRDQNQLATDPRGTATPFDWSARDGGFVTLQGRYRAGAVELAADGSYRDQVSRANFVSFASYSEARLRNFVFSPRLKWTTEALGMAHSLVLGSDLGEWHFSRPVAANPESISAPVATTNAAQRNTAAYVQFNSQLTPALKVTLGARSQQVSDHLIQTGFAAADQSRRRNPRAAEAGVQYALSPRLTAFGRIGTSFRVATVDENGFTATGRLLEPQTARHRDAGLEYRGSAVRFGLSAYAMDLKDEIYFSPIVVPFGANTNLSPTRRAGVELFASVSASPRLQFAGSIVAQQAKFREGVYGGVDVSGKDVPLVPRSLVTLRASWLVTPNLRLLASTRHVGRQRYDNDQANAFPDLMPSYSLSDLEMSYSAGAWSFAAAVKNLADKRYYSYGIVNSFACATAVCAYPQAGRTLFASASYAFK